MLPGDGGGRLLWGGRSTPLGAYGPGEQRDEAAVQLEPGDRLLLYSDGLVERRDRGLDEGPDLLVRTAAELGPQPVEELVRGLTEAVLRHDRGRDDLCVLLLSWAGPPFERRLGACRACRPRATSSPAGCSSTGSTRRAARTSCSARAVRRTGAAPGSCWYRSDVAPGTRAVLSGTIRGAAGRSRPTRRTRRGQTQEAR